MNASQRHRYLFSGGGTGGGIYPAIAIVNALQAQDPAAEVLWVGSRSGVETQIVPAAGIDYQGVSGGPVVGVGLRAIPNLFRLLAGAIQSFGIAGRFKPRACLITGGWATIPAALGCWLRGVPVVIYLPDVEPAAAINALSALATRVAVTIEASTAFFRPGKAVTTGYPLRADLLEAAGYSPAGDPLPDREERRASARNEARQRFDLTADLPALLVFGGSRGARSLNTALLANLPEILERAQVIHISGTLDAEAVQARAEQIRSDLEAATASRYHTYEYLQSGDMALALAAADLAVSRAGASTLGEFPLFDLPAILVPYPFAWRYQKTNADALETQGAAVRLDDDQLTDHLTPLIRQILDDDAGRQRMAQAAGALKRPDAAWDIGLLLTGVAHPTTDSSSVESRG